MELLRTCRYKPDVMQSECHPFFSNATVRSLCAEHGIAFMAYGPLSGGHIERAAKLKGVDNPTVKAVARSAGRTPAQVVLRWAIMKGIAVVPKSTRREGVEENAKACGFDLTEGQMQALNGLETGQPSYWNPECVDTLDHFNVFLDKEGLQREIGGG